MIRKIILLGLKNVSNIGSNRGISISMPCNYGITAEKIGPVTAIEINLPESKNCLDKNSYEELREALTAFDNDDTSSACAIYGMGGNFCTGCGPEFRPDPQYLIGHVKKPVIASITGYATGFGFELALLCDLRVMEETAQLGLSSYPHQMSRIAYERLVCIVGLSYALDIGLTGRNVHHKEAAQIGLINRLVDCGTGVGQGIQLAKTVGKYPAESLRNVKAAVLETLQVRSKI